MVAETVKSYPYPALLPLATQQGLNYSCTTSCSSALLPQALSQSYSPSSAPQSHQNRMERSNGHMRSNGNSATSALAVNVSPTPSGLGAGGMIGSNVLKDSIFAQRKQREFIPDNKKDESYWDRRRRNNEAAKRSREKRRFNDMILEQRVLELSKENHLLRAQVTAFENKFHMKGEGLVNEEQVLASMPQADQILALTRRPSLSLLSSMASPPSLLSPASLPSSPPASVAPGSNNDDQYTMPQYAQHQHLEQSNHSPPQQSSRLRSTSPDYYSRDLPSQTHEPYSPESTNYYESTALNLSARSSRSPAHMEYCDDQSNRSVDYVGGSCLPHKLRHKNNAHGATMSNHHFNIASHHLRPQSTSPMLEPLPPTVSHHYQHSASPSLSHHHHQSSLHHNAPRPASPSSSTHLLYPIKSEPIPSREVGEESPGSSDDRDSGISLAASPTLSGEASYPSSNRDSTEDMDCDGDNQLRAEVQRLAAELRSIKKSLTHRGSDGDRNKGNGQRR